MDFDVRKLNNIINSYTVSEFYKNFTKIEIPVNLNAICYDEYYIYYNSLKLLIRYVNNKVVGYIVGDAAKFEYHKLLGENELNIEKIFTITNNLFKISKADINRKTRIQEVVWCRYLIVWFYIKFITHNYSQCAKDMVWVKNTDHASTLRAFGIIENEDDKYLKPFQRDFRQKFFEEIKKYGYK